MRCGVLMICLTTVARGAVKGHAFIVTGGRGRRMRPAHLCVGHRSSILSKGASTSAAEGEAASSSHPPSPFSRNINQVKPGTIYFVSTPLGNLGDITLRALDVLRAVDLVASEDTRTTGNLLRSLGIEGKRQLSHHAHNTQGRVPDLIARARKGASIAVVTDAGTPGISDPGAELAKACWEAQVPLVPVPGACAAVAAMSVSGFLSTEFVFFGFLPSKSGKSRRDKLAQVAAELRACVLYESPHRLLKTLQELIDLAPGSMAQRDILCARELTKLHEELWRGTIEEAIRHFGGGDGEGPSGASPRGEFTLVLGPVAKAAPDEMEAKEEARELLRLMMSEEGKPMSDAVKRVAKAVEGVTRADVYAMALELKGVKGGE